MHMGHRFLFEQLCSEGASRGLKPLIVTFDTHPRAVLESDYQPQLLTTFAERKALLLNMINMPIIFLILSIVVALNEWFLHLHYNIFECIVPVGWQNKPNDVVRRCSRN